MEHPCEKCGAPVEDGVPFCPGCNAPQIRVSVAPDRAVTRPFPPGTPGDIQPPATPVSPSLATNKVQWRLALPGSAIAGFLLAVAMRLLFIPPFLLMIFAGGLAAAFYAQRSPAPVRAAQGARVGALSGLFAAAITALFTGLQIALGGGHEMLAQLKQAIADQVARNPDPSFRRLMDKMAEPGGLALVLVLFSITLLMVLLACSAIGGAMAGAFFGRRRNVR